jgi:hypothetical protein
MSSKQSTLRFFRIYLALVPLLFVIVGFGIGHVSYKLYLPVWIIHSCLMVAAARGLGIRLIKTEDHSKNSLFVTSFLLILPWILFTLFAGMGRPPLNAAGWVETATEQQIRFSILILGGVIMSVGLVLLKERLKSAGENFYSAAGITAYLVAIPLFILNMLFWGYYLVEVSKLFVTLPAGKRPDWYAPLRELLIALSSVEVALIYLATAAFAASLRKTGIFRPGVCTVYILLSGLGIILGLLPPSLPEPLATLGYIAAVPAIPFVMPYLMGINLLWRDGADYKLIVASTASAM